MPYLHELVGLQPRTAQTAARDEPGLPKMPVGERCSLDGATEAVERKGARHRRRQRHPETQTVETSETPIRYTTSKAFPGPTCLSR
jgi:hypothetical protein